MAVTHLVKVKSGETYVDRNGVEKEGYVTIGRMVETAKGNKVIFLEVMPFTWLRGEPVVMYLQDKDRERAPATEAPKPAAEKPKQADFDDDIPF
jgi:hypothetical protein